MFQNHYDKKIEITPCNYDEQCMNIPTNVYQTELRNR